MILKSNFDVEVRLLQILHYVATHSTGFEILPVTFEHTAVLVNLELHHRDPFDRVMIAQAISEQLMVIGKDENFYKYTGRKLLW